MGERNAFIALAQGEGANIRELCRRFEISPPTAYKWLARYREDGWEALADQSRRPKTSPERTAAPMEAAVLAVRAAHPAWGGRKIRAWLEARRSRQAGTAATAVAAVPAASTVTEILRRHGRLDPTTAAQHRAWQRFEHPRPNALWQMDFKGHFPLVAGATPRHTSAATEPVRHAGSVLGMPRCHPLTILDDHSRFALAVDACGNERDGTVRERLMAVFRRYGLPERMLMDNGSPWGDAGDQPYTALTVWLLRLGIAVSHGRPRHPQTQGKEERFHRTLRAEVLQGRTFSDLVSCQRAFDTWRQLYNTERPHQALGMAVPLSRYQVSPRAFPETLPPLEYSAGDLVRIVHAKGLVLVHGRAYRLSKAFRGQPVALRPTTTDGRFAVYFGTHPIAHLDRRCAPDAPDAVVMC
jgi:transposase InsO family protein